ncbi:MULTISPECIES: LysR family transcriptional regulator [Marinomonas]|jgi:transcriptional regulator, LysR family|uniref:Transcriptional regulator, LysR family n=2 Tax=Marinomonas TaxID=28253 RepID=F2K3T4_MARM1|nr:LysR family transcriptional regulator [Marinomonas mediterranea]TDO98117.1 LysR family transcriptional regulator [Marinomonas balearica]ADZ90183.1 transcriptional regulator, LysR family [Marinomonas mediterranea MMB-1]WCN08244.1 LysR family transcriptional regulator [Marinomonas mediterranea]WCN12310.1 LysR family transcriptional regulator [Marinomonas mediterranea]WCN16382.1 LysR family transcriptional regulator [Marinomonas mediterranea MMB-1]
MHQIEFRDLTIFIKVAETGNFREAAEATFLSQPALSRRIQRLEEVLGTQLFERTTRKTKLTAVGREFLPKARRMLEEFELSILGIKDMASQQKGSITIACIPTAAFYFLPSVIKAFNEKYPGIRIKILDESANQGLESVIQGDADFGINMAIAQHSEVSFTPLLDDPFVVCMRKDHALAELKEVSWKDLEPYRLISVGRSSGNRLLLDKSIVRDQVNLNSFYEVQHLSTSLGLVETGLGLSIVPKLAMPIGTHSMLTSRPLTGVQIDRSIGLVKRNATPVSPSADLFIQILLEQWSSN